MCIAGATYGVYTALTGLKLPGQATAVAEGNALGKGALVFHLSSSALQTLQDRAAGKSLQVKPFTATCCQRLVV